MKTKIILIVIIIALMGSVSVIGKLYLDKVKESNRHETNYNLEKSEVKRFKDEKGQYAITVQELQLTARELKESNDSLYLDAIQLRNKKRQLEQLLSVKTSTIRKEIEIPIYDTVIIRVDKQTINRIATIESEWLNAEIAVFDDKLELLNYESKDEIVIILKKFKERKFFVSRWFENWKFAADIQSKNPNSTITHARNIKITKKTGR